MDVVEQVKAAVLPALEAAAKQIIEAQSDKAVDLALGKVMELIPGHFEDAIVLGLAPQIKAFVKEQLLAQAEKIS